MAILQPLWLREEEVPPLPGGWRTMQTSEVTVQLKPGNLFEKKTVGKVGFVPVLSQGVSDFIGFHDEMPGVFASPDKLVVTFANHTCAMRLMKRPFSCIQNIFPKIGKKGVCDTRYFYYAAQGRVNLSDYKGHHPLFREAYIPVPPLPTQRKIAAILSAYDDLIENNLQRVNILEEMAENLYREWFVKFRFPGHQHAHFTNSPLGLIPEGWAVVKVGETLKKVKRGTKIQKKDYATEGSIPIVDQGKDFLGGYTDNTESLISDDLPLIVFGDHTRILKFIDFPFACGADGTQLLKSNDERMPMTLFYYVLSAIDISDFAYARHFKFLKEEPLVLPERSIADLFNQFVTPLFEQKRSLMQKDNILRRTRDLLLPQLISGEMDVSELDIAVTEEASA